MILLTKGGNLPHLLLRFSWRFSGFVTKGIFFSLFYYLIFEQHHFYFRKFYLEMYFFYYWLRLRKNKFLCKLNFHWIYNSLVCVKVINIYKIIRKICKENKTETLEICLDIKPIKMPLALGLTNCLMVSIEAFREKILPNIFV